MAHSYVHGYSDPETQRLFDQADTLTNLLHYDSFFPSGSRIFEAGCGTGAQTCILARQNPDCAFVSVDISGESLAVAKKRVADAGYTNVTFHQADIVSAGTSFGLFDHAIFCFVLEHLKDPKKLFSQLCRW